MAAFVAAACSWRMCQAPQAPATTTRPAARDDHRLSIGERTKTVVQVCRTGTLCTTSAKHDSTPFGSHADYILDEEGRPLFLLANSAAHSQNLSKVSPQCSLFCQSRNESGQGGSRATLVGSMSVLPTEEQSSVVEAYVDTHPYAGEALRYPERFSFHRMAVEDIYFVGGFGVTATWVDPNEYRRASADPLALDAPRIVEQMNTAHVLNMRLLCRVFLGISDVESVTMMALDRLGFDLRVHLRGDRVAIQEYRVGFRERVWNRVDAQSALVKVMQEAWELDNGYGDDWADELPRVVLCYYDSSTPA